MIASIYPQAVLYGKQATVESDTVGVLTVIGGDTTGTVIGMTYFAGTHPNVPFVTLELDDGIEKKVFELPLLSHLGVVAEIISKFLGLPKAQVTVYNQKYDIPKDDKLYLAVGTLNSKSIGNNRRNISDADKLYAHNYVSNADTIEIHISSKGNKALQYAPDVVMALNSDYSQKLQEMFGLKLSTIPNGMNNISGVEGAAFIYRFNITLIMMYSLSRIEEIMHYEIFDYQIRG